MFIDYQKAKDKLLAGFDKDCQQFFVKNGCVLEDAYLHFLMGDLPYAKKQFALIKDSDIRAHWALFEISLIGLNQRTNGIQFFMGFGVNDHLG